MTPKHEYPWRDQYSQTWGLEVTSRDPKTRKADAAICCFCQTFGRETAPSKSGNVMNSTTCLAATLIDSRVVVGGWKSLVFTIQIREPRQKEKSVLYNITCLGKILLPLPTFNLLNQSLKKGEIQYDKPSAITCHYYTFCTYGHNTSFIVMVIHRCD